MLVPCPSFGCPGYLPGPSVLSFGPWFLPITPSARTGCSNWPTAHVANGIFHSTL